MIDNDDSLDTVQSRSGANLLLRFYGRFVFVRLGQKLRVLAVDVSSHNNTKRDDPHDKTNTDDPDCHIPFMTLREKNVGSATLKPSSRIMGTEVVPFQGALNVWNLKKWIVTVQSDGGVRWPDDERINLADLKHLGDSDIHPQYLPPHGPSGRVTAIIEIAEGSGFLFHLPDKQTKNPLGTRYDIVTVKNRTTPVPNQPTNQALADMVQITLNLPPQGVKLAVAQNGSPTTPTARKDYITVNPAADAVVVLSFSNLCSGDLEKGPDLEFAQFYSILKVPPPHDDRKIPTLHPAGFITESPRFGDCFLGAMISGDPTSGPQ